MTTLATPALPSSVPPRRRRALSRWLGLGLETYVSLPLFALLLIVAGWFAVLQMIDAERSAAREAALDATRELVDTYEAQMARSLSGIDQTLRVLKYAVELNGPTGALPALQGQGLLPHGLVFHVTITDAEGRVVASNPNAGARDLSSMPWFAWHRTASRDAPYVSETDVDELGEAHVHFSRRINDGAGRFAGVAVVAVDPAYFTSSYERSRQGERGLLGLAGQDGLVRALRVGEQVGWGQRIDPTPADAVGLRAIGADSELRYSSTRALNGFPLVALVGLSQTEQMNGFEQQRRAWLLGASAATALLLGVVTLVSAWSWQLAKARRRERRAQQTYAAASEASLDAFFVLRSVPGPDGAVLDFLVETANSRAEQLTGLSKEQMAGQRMSVTLPAPLGASIFEDLAAVARDGVPREAEWLAHALPVPDRWLHRQVVPVEGGVVAIMRDITERKLTEQRIRHLAHHDDLTGLPNRSLLRDRLGQAIRDAERKGGAVGLAFIDLDGFKLVNDGLGHNAGDELLKVVGARMGRCLRRTDTLARFGGDEFVILLPDLTGDPMAITPLLERVRQAVTEPVLVEGQEVQVSSSIGVAFYPRDGADTNTLMMNADAAMYRAKDLGNNNVQFYASEMNASVEEKLVLLEGLRAALDTCVDGHAGPCQFELLYQPKVDLRSNRLFGVEALIRWHHPEHGMVSPLRFISLAEESGLIVPIGEWVMRTACRQAQAWRDAGLPPISVSVNVSARQFEEKRLVERIEGALRDSGLAPAALEVEVTESSIMRDLARSVDKMRELEAMGVSLSIDDFGTGYSSLSALKSFPISRLKIDKSFVRDLAESPDDQAIAMAVISLGHKLDLRVIAEGVETEQQRDFLCANDCDEMQGYLFSRPVQAERIAALLAQASGEGGA
jgi:diguanylate cyclase (GGDEF)-like protein/PAS domain S-box-containing protein